MNHDKKMQIVMLLCLLVATFVLLIGCTPTAPEAEEPAEEKSGILLPKQTGLDPETGEEFPPPPPVG